MFGNVAEGESGQNDYLPMTQPSKITLYKRLKDVSTGQVSFNPKYRIRSHRARPGYYVGAVRVGAVGPLPTYGRSLSDNPAYFR